MDWAAAGDANLVSNGSFTAAAGGRPAEWTVRDSGQKVALDKQEKPAGRLRVVAASESHGIVGVPSRLEKATRPNAIWGLRHRLAACRADRLKCPGVLHLRRIVRRRRGLKVSQV